MEKLLLFYNGRPNKPIDKLRYTFVHKKASHSTPNDQLFHFRPTQRTVLNSFNSIGYQLAQLMGFPGRLHEMLRITHDKNTALDASRACNHE